jgi:inorganic pyrophosphatase
MESWRKFLKEVSYTPGGVSMPAGQPSSPCPQGTEQNGFDEHGEPFCRETPEPIIRIHTKEELVDYLKENPNQKIHLDRPKGSTGAFGTNDGHKLPFDYGEWPNITNPADDQGWDLIIVPSATKDSPSLIPVGYLTYNKEKEDKKGNDKIIVAPYTNYTGEDKKIIEDFFKNLSFFNPAIWY